jgi:GMP synthase (glutamine-hydrolysing)
MIYTFFLGEIFMKQDLIAIIDMGRDDNSALARKIRDFGVYSEVYPHDSSLESLKLNGNLKGIILNGPEKDGVELNSKMKFSSIAPVTNADKIYSSCNLEDFLFKTTACNKNWNMENFIEDQITLIRNTVGKGKVLLALSGGVDSSVVAALLIRAIGGEKLFCVHVNHGLLRKGEPEQVIEVFGKNLKQNLIYVDASERFLSKLKDVSDPERKRKIIGAEFIRVFEEEARKLNGIEFLGQGTIYPDIVESGTKAGKAVKAHHNVGGLPADLTFKLIEPLKYLFKDEVRACGKALGLPDNMVFRQPFPGPGLGVRCLGAITRDRLEAVREADAILREEFEKHNLSRKVWQYFTLIPDIKSVGVRDNMRSLGYPVIIRAVNTVDAMTATIEHIDWTVLDIITKRIINEIPSVNRVCYDLTPKPTGTIEWE